MPSRRIAANVLFVPVFPRFELSPWGRVQFRRSINGVKIFVSALQNQNVSALEANQSLLTGARVKEAGA